MKHYDFSKVMWRWRVRLISCPAVKNYDKCLLILTGHPQTNY